MNQQPSAQREPPPASPVREALPSESGRFQEPVTGAVSEREDTAAPVSPIAPTQDELLAVAERVRSAFPHPVAEGELVLIDVDPRYLHAFWTVPFVEANRVLGRLGDDAASAPMVLRICPVDSDGNALPEAFDIEVLGLQGTFYIDVWDTPRRYRATLGYRLADGTLVPLAASGVAELPPVGPADDRTWREIALPAPSEPPATLAAVAPRRAPVMPDPAEMAPREEPADLAQVDAPMTAATPADALPSRIAALSPRNGGDVAAPQLAADTGAPPLDAGNPPAAAAAAARMAASSAPLPRSPDQPPGEPVAADQRRPSAAAAPFAHSDHRPDTAAGSGGERERPFWEMSGGATGAGSDLPFWEMSAGDSPDASSEGTHAAPEPAPMRGDQPGTEEAGQAPAAGEEGPPALPLPQESVLSLSSFLLGSDPVELEVNAELHVFGRVKPGSRLQLFGREVRVRPDGTFSVHRPLGSGAAIMPVLLTEKDEAEMTAEGCGAPPGETE